MPDGYYYVYAKGDKVMFINIPGSAVVVENVEGDEQGSNVILTCFWLDRNFTFNRIKIKADFVKPWVEPV